MVSVRYTCVLILIILVSIASVRNESMYWVNRFSSVKTVRLSVVWIARTKFLFHVSLLYVHLRRKARYDSINFQCLFDC